MDTENNIEVMTVSSLAGFGISRVCLGIGFFDGVHRGHQRLLESLLAISRELDAVPCALTFFPHPRAILSPGNAPPLLMSPEQKNQKLREAGMKAVITIPFTHEFAELAPDEFIKKCLCSSSVAVAGIAIGTQWRFGRGGSGNLETLKQIGKLRNWRVEAVDELEIDGHTVSSTAIRRAVAGGRLVDAAAMLGRGYSLLGTVRHGFKVASRELSHPTANLEIRYGILPPDGVYGAVAIFDGMRHPAAVNIGLCPTYHRSGSEVRVEVHVLDYYGDLYERQIELEFLSYLREERTFAGSAELKAQIAADIEQIRKLL